MPPTRILICSPIRLYCEGLARLLGADAAFEVVGLSTSGAWAEQAARLQPDVVLVDLADPACADVTALAAEVAPGSRTVALSVVEDEAAIVGLARAGITAFVSRDAALDELRATIARVVRGESDGPAWLMPMLLRRLAAGHDPGDRGQPTALERLTRRERQVLELVADGRSNKQIARDLQIELPTVKNHVHNILEKLAVNRRSEAVACLHRAR